MLTLSGNGRLTKKPELRTTESGKTVTGCSEPCVAPLGAVQQQHLDAIALLADVALEADDDRVCFALQPCGQARDLSPGLLGGGVVDGVGVLASPRDPVEGVVGWARGRWSGRSAADSARSHAPPRP